MAFKETASHGPTFPTPPPLLLNKMPLVREESAQGIVVLAEKQNNTRQGIFTRDLAIGLSGFSPMPIKAGFFLTLQNIRRDATLK